MNHDTPLNHETPWARDLPAIVDAPRALAPLILEAAGAPAVGEKRAPGRPATVRTLHLALAVLWCVLSGWRTQRAVWRLICTRSLGPFGPTPVSDQAIYNRLEAQGEQTMRALFEQVSQWLHEWLTPYQDSSLAPFASAIYSLDECVLDPMGRWIRSLWAVAAGDSALLAGRLSALFDVRRQQWVRLDLLPEAGANCKVHARAMLEGLSAGCLLLFDLGYYAFEWFDDLTRQGFFWISRVRHNASFVVIHVFVESEDYCEKLIQLGAYRADRAEYTVRLVEFRYRGTWYRYLTNVLNPMVLSGSQIARLYARRWDIEMAFRALKAYLGLRVIWSAKWAVIQVQIWACAILAQFFHAFQVRLAAEAEVEVFDVSLEILIEQVTQRLWAGTLPPMSDLLVELAREGRQIALIRPSSRITIVVPEVPWTGFAWPPDDLVYQRPPRYGHRPAGNLNRQAATSCVT